MAPGQVLNLETLPFSSHGSKLRALTVVVNTAALERLRRAKRPANIVGHGARFHMPAVLEFAEKLNSPVITTFKAKGLVSDMHPLGCGVLGRSGTPIGAPPLGRAIPSHGAWDSSQNAWVRRMRCRTIQTR